MWPQAIFQASRLGVLATVECNADWQKVEQALTSKTPVVCSVRFAKDELQHAPLTQTAGHLVLLYGFTGNSVLVLDPAAENPAEVPRIYDRAQFTTAWLRQRGAAYFSVSRTDLSQYWNPSSDPTSILLIQPRQCLHAPDTSLRTAHLEFCAHNLWLTRLAAPGFFPWRRSPSSASMDYTQ